MSEILITNKTSKKAGFGRMRKADVRIDMTPMVDLGFLLITFFVFTAEVSKPVTTHLYMPHNGDSTKIAGSKSLTFLLCDHDRIFYYFGTPGDAVPNHRVIETSYNEGTGIGQIIRDRQSALSRLNVAKKELIVLLKPAHGSTYKNVVDALDEMLINDVSRYALADFEPLEKVALDPFFSNHSY